MATRRTGSGRRGTRPRAGQDAAQSLVYEEPTDSTGAGRTNRSSGRKESRQPTVTAFWVRVLGRALQELPASAAGSPLFSVAGTLLFTSAAYLGAAWIASPGAPLSTALMTAVAIPAGLLVTASLLVTRSMLRIPVAMIARLQKQASANRKVVAAHKALEVRSRMIEDLATLDADEVLRLHPEIESLAQLCQETARDIREFVASRDSGAPAQREEENPDAFRSRLGHYAINTGEIYQLRYRPKLRKITNELRRVDRKLDGADGLLETLAGDLNAKPDQIEDVAVSLLSISHELQALLEKTGAIAADPPE